MEVEARGKRRTVYLTDHLWRLARSWAIANDQTVSEGVEQTLLLARAGLRADAVAEAQKAGRRLEPADARPVPTTGLSHTDARPPMLRPVAKPVAKPPGVSTNKAFSEFRPAPKPTSRKKR